MGAVEVNGYTIEPRADLAGANQELEPGRSAQSRAVGRATCAGVPALQLAAGCTHDEPTPQPASRFEGLVMRRYQRVRFPPAPRRPSGGNHLWLDQYPPMSERLLTASRSLMRTINQTAL